MDELRLWLASKTYNQCPAFWERIDLGVSRQCPLAVEIADMIGEYSTVPFICEQYRNGCPIEDRMIEETLNLMEVSRC